MTLTNRGYLDAQVHIPSAITFTAINGSGSGTCTLAAGDRFITGTSGLLKAFENALNAGRPSGWTVTIDTTGGSGIVTIAGSGGWSINLEGDAAGLQLKKILGWHEGSPMDGTPPDEPCTGIWFPDCTFRCDLAPAMLPVKPIRTSSISPSGRVTTLVTGAFYRHTNVRWTHVPWSRITRLQALTTLGYSRLAWEAWLDDTQLGRGGWSYFTPGSPFQIYWDGTNVVGFNNSHGWQIPDPDLAVQLSLENGFLGLWRLQLPEITSQG